MFERIHVPIDFSDRAVEAAKYAAAIADHFGSKMQLVHVVEQPVNFDFSFIEPSAEMFRVSAKKSADVLAAFAAETFPGRDVPTELLEGDPADQILCASRRSKADLIVMPTRGRSRLRQFLIGSVAAKVLHDSAAPVWTGIHLHQRANFPELQLANILCAVDFGSQSNAALRHATRLATEFEAKLTVLHVAPDCSYDSEGRLEGLLAPFSTKAITRVEVGVPNKVVTATAGQMHADLVVIGRASSTGMIGRLREQAYAIVRDSPCPVLSV